MRLGNIIARCPDGPPRAAASNQTRPRRNIAGDAGGLPKGGPPETEQIWLLNGWLCGRVLANDHTGIDQVWLLNRRLLWRARAYGRPEWRDNWPHDCRFLKPALSGGRATKDEIWPQDRLDRGRTHRERRPANGRNPAATSPAPWVGLRKRPPRNG